MFDVLVDELRTRTTECLRREREQLITQQRNLRTREMAVLAVLDERGQIDCSIGTQGESARTMRDKIETARALESLPAIASVALDGGLSDEQLSSVVKVADAGSDQEWARRAPSIDPVELDRMARRASRPSTEDSRARFAARELRMWQGRRDGMLHLRGQLPDAMGTKFEETIRQLTEQMKVKGEPGPRSSNEPPMRSWRCVSPKCPPTSTSRRWPRCRSCRSPCPCRDSRTSLGSRSPTACWSSCERTRRSSWCSSTTMVRLWGSPGGSRRCRRS
jgi:hypothetical protein